MQLHHVLYIQKKAQIKINIGYLIFPKNLAGNDIGSLEHALSRRLKYYEDKHTKPDLLLIDGGKNTT